MSLASIDLCLCFPLSLLFLTAISYLSRVYFTSLYFRTPPINAQCGRSMPIKILALIPMWINSDQCRSIPINDQHWEAFRINAMILIGIDRHWLALGIDRGSPVYLKGWNNTIRLTKVMSVIFSKALTFSQAGFYCTILDFNEKCDYFPDFTNLKCRL